MFSIERRSWVLFVLVLPFVGSFVVGCPLVVSSDKLTFDWVKQAGGTGSDRGYAISAFDDGSSVVAGYFSGTAAFGPGETGETSWTSAGDKDICVAQFNTNGTLAWASAAGGTGTDWGQGVAAYPGGGCLVTGFFNGDATFGADKAETTLHSAGGKDIFVARYDGTGQLVWAVSAGSAGDDEGASVAAIADGTLVVTGFCSGEATFNSATTAATVLPVAGGAEDIFLAKYDADGDLVWLTGAGGAGLDKGLGVCAFPNGTSAITGRCTGSVNFSATASVTGYGGTDIFVTKYDSAGIPIWARNAGSAGDDAAVAICALDDGSCAITGFYTGTADFICPCGAEDTLVSAGSTDIFVAKFLSNGNFKWAKSAGGTEADEGIAIAANGDTLAVTGSFKQTATFSQVPTDKNTITSAGEDDIFVAKYSLSGSLTSLVKAGGTALDKGLGIELLSDGTTLTTGRFRQSSTWGQGAANETTLTAPGDGLCDIYLARYEDKD